jgi:hypothetical protein
MRSLHGFSTDFVMVHKGTPFSLRNARKRSVLAVSLFLALKASRMRKSDLSTLVQVLMS